MIKNKHAHIKISNWEQIGIEFCSPMTQLKNKVAIVTGAASGIGKAIVQSLVAEECNVIAADNNQERLSELPLSLPSQSTHQLQTCLTDMSNEDQIEHMISTALTHYGKLDILINNAGIMDHFEAVGDISNLQWEKIIKVNLEGPMKAMRSACRLFLKQGNGVILNIASIGGLYGCRAGAAYTTSKHGLIGLTKNTGYFYAKDGIRCNAIAPGAVTTNILEGFNLDTLSPKIKERIMGGTQTNPRYGEASEIAKAAVFLVSDQSSFINGAILTIDGGWTAY